ncbi:hypothetical protein BEP19_03210 [Ammoniphilus oxalaticus]|uniref:Uncharacterized protein n=1 Tax=Ammoniphilus oxalaticus TaxID=66863 RepID=A0A419SNT8_9BACL|nr:hypothetical protein BEP19_03210 [Ammoniphilus oxalaticus]
MDGRWDLGNEADAVRRQLRSLRVRELLQREKRPLDESESRRGWRKGRISRYRSKKWVCPEIIECNGPSDPYRSNLTRGDALTVKFPATARRRPRMQLIA